jgi:hypothetical protein
LIDARARDWFAADRDCQVWEPGGEDFLSPALIEAACMRAILPSAEFRRWLVAFLPGLGAGEPPILFEPARRRRSDVKIASTGSISVARGAGARSPPRSIRRRGAGGPRARQDASERGDRSCRRHWLATYALALDGLGGEPLSSSGSKNGTSLVVE